MKKPNNYDNTSTSDFIPVTLGGHIAVIKNVSEDSKNGKDFIVVSFDFAPDDKQAGYFMQSYNADTRQDKKWPFNGTKYIFTTDPEGNTNKDFKRFVTAVEDSTGMKADWKSDNWGAQFKSKRVGIVYREEEYEYHDEIRKSPKPWRFCDVKKALDAEIPKPKLLNKEQDQSPETGTSDGGFMELPNTDDEFLPFR